MAIEQAARAKWESKRCLHPEAGRGRCDRIIKAHTIQRSGILSRIVDQQNVVFTFFQSRPGRDGSYVPREVGWRDASTFTGFCKVHDAVFSPLEAAPFTNAPEQRFLLAYRAICHEVYQKSASLSAQPIYRDLLDRGMSSDEQAQVQETIRTFGAGVESGLIWAQIIKGQMDRELLESDFGKLSWLTIRFDGPLSVVSTGAVTPNRDLTGKTIQRLHDLNAEVEPLFFGVTAAEGGGTAVFGWRHNHAAPQLFVKSLLERGRDRLPSSIVQFMFAYIENTYFSRDWWTSLNTRQRETIADHAVNPNPYFVPTVFDGDPLVPWQITSIVEESAR